jgi:protein-disulfide isomerase
LSRDIVTIRQKLETGTNLVLTLCALAITVMMVRSQFFSRPPAQGELRPEREKQWRSYATGDMRIGQPSAPVTVTEFSDFECPACARLHRTLKTVRERRGNRIAIVYRNYPLNEIHPSARPAAIAAQCAARQGKFAEYHDYLFSHQDSLKSLAWVSVAAQVGVADTSGFAACLADPATSEALQRDSTAAAALKIAGTPLVLINGWLYKGAPSLAVLDSVVMAEAALAAP